MNKLLWIAVALGTAGMSSPMFAASPHAVGAATRSALAINETELVEVGLARKAFSAYLAAWSSEGVDLSNLSHAISKDAVLEFGVARYDWTFNIEGEDAIAEYVRDLNGIASNWKFSDIYYFPTLERNIVFVQYEASFMRKVSGKTEIQKHVASIEMNGEQISRVCDFADSRWIFDLLLGDTGRNATVSVSATSAE